MEMKILWAHTISKKQFFMIFSYQNWNDIILWIKIKFWFGIRECLIEFLSNNNKNTPTIIRYSRVNDALKPAPSLFFSVSALHGAA